MQIKYIRTGLFKSNSPEVIESKEKLPSLGIAEKESAINCTSFLVMKRETKILIRSVNQIDGTTRYAIDQKENPESVQFQPGGLYSPEVFLHGRIATIWSTAGSTSIYRILQQDIKMRYTKAKAYFVSKACIQLYQKGVRLTDAAQSPREGDLEI